MHDTAHLPACDQPESWQSLRGKYANRVRNDPDGDHSELRDEVLRARREARIAELIETAPPLTPEQAERLRGLLPPAPPRDGGRT